LLKRSAAALLLLCLATPPGFAEWPVPTALEGRIAALSEQQQAFLTSGKVLEFIPQQQLEHEIATREPERLLELVDDLMALAELMAYDPARDMGAIPLNLQSRRFNMPLRV